MGIYSKNIGVFFGNRIVFKDIYDGMKIDVIGNELTVLDVKSEEGSQFGFQMKYDDNKKLSFLGDAFYNDSLYENIKDSNWLIHEAFCLESENHIFKAHEKNHSTVKDTCEIANRLNADNLILVHTEDSNIENRKKLYSEEGKQYYNGNLIIPDDLEVIDLI